jgi:thymidylate synthase (FAD)
VNSARVSFGGNNNEPLSDKDKKLIKYLADHEHMSPFEHLSLTIKVEVPLYIRSQIHRHRTFSYNEISRRYTDKDLKFYKADTFRKQHESNRQASYGALDSATEDMVRVEIEEFHKRSMELYESLMAMGVCREQARGVLAQDLMTEFYMSGNLRNFVHFVKLRLHEGAQVEVQVVAQKVKEILIDKFGYAAKTLLED